ncbi:MAG: chemotaxis protein CheA [Pseudomonadota bacterium]
MSLNADPELLQDFLIEAGELLDALDKQLVELERAPDDRNLLNAVFRSFHTIKGGAGFLEVHPLVEVCHRAEDVFNMLRNGELGVDARLMDVMLRVLDTLKLMFDALREGKMPTAADPEQLLEIEGLMHPGSATAAPEPVVPLPTTKDAAEDEVEQAYLDMLGEAASVTVAASSNPVSEHITESEFDNLLDEIYGAGKGPSSAPKSAPEAKTPVRPAKDEKADLITEDEFENLLDSLYGEGKGPSTSRIETPAPAKPAPAAKTTPVPKVAPASKPAARQSAPAQSESTPQAERAESTVRVDTERLDAIMNLVGELVLVRNRLNTLKSSFQDEQVGQVIASLDMVTADLQSAVMKTRMQPVKKVFGRFPRVVRDVARTLGKEVELVMEGEETDLDKNLVEALADPLVHLVRNAVDHGVEMPDARVGVGKPRSGTVMLSAAQEGDHILLTIRDDGAGMDPERLRRKAVEKGLMDADAAARLTPRECFELIFAPGFSTKDQISDISGRGVGMDVVKTAITKLSGSIAIDSSLGVGTLISIKVPLTLAILPTLMVVVNERKYAMPLGNVNEIFEMEGKTTNMVDGQRTITVRNRALPLFDLRRWMAIRGEAVQNDEKDAQIVMIQIGTQNVGVIVDRVLGQEEVVIKPLGDLLHGLPGFAGATITGDGHIALIFDLPGLVKHFGQRRGERLVA